MHDHDEQLLIDLLSEMELAESPISRRDLIARLGGCESCTSDVIEQQAVMQLLGSLDTPVLTKAERSSLHAGASTELDANKVIELPSRRRFDWTKVGAVAAAFVGLVAVAGLIGSVAGNDDASDTADVAAAVVESDSVGQASDAEEAAALEAAPAEPAADFAADDAADTDLGTTARPSNLIRSMGVVTAEAFNRSVEESIEDVIGTETSGILTRSLDETTAACYAGLDRLDSVWAVVTGEVDGSELEAYVYSDGEVVVLVTDGCDATSLP